MFSFEKSWNKIKNSLRELLGIQDNLENKIDEVTKLVKIAMAAGDEKTAIALRFRRAKLFRMRPIASEVTTKTKVFLPKWQKAVNEDKGLGIVFAVAIGLAGVAAASYVAVKGMKLLKDFKRESVIIDRLRDKTLTAEQAKGLIKSSAAFDPINLKVGGGMLGGMSLAIPLVIGGFILWMRR